MTQPDAPLAARLEQMVRDGVRLYVEPLAPAVGESMAAVHVVVRSAHSTYREMHVEPHLFGDAPALAAFLGEMVDGL